MTFDSCANCRKAMAGPSPQLFRAMLSFLRALEKPAPRFQQRARALARALDKPATV